MLARDYQPDYLRPIPSSVLTLLHAAKVHALRRCSWPADCQPATSGNFPLADSTIHTVVESTMESG
eukprot:358650-Chlamydomonas_euryale.AAC.2